MCKQENTTFLVVFLVIFSLLQLIYVANCINLPPRPQVTRMYFGGSFSSVNGFYFPEIKANNIAYYDRNIPGEPFPVGNGTNGEVKVVKVDVWGNVYIGGSFTIAGSIVGGPIAVYNAYSREWINTGLSSDQFSTGSTVTSMSLSCLKNLPESLDVGGMFPCDIIVGGFFNVSLTNNEIATNLIRFEYATMSWKAITGIIGSPKSVAFLSNRIFIGGKFEDSEFYIYDVVNNLTIPQLNVRDVEDIHVHQDYLGLDTILVAAASFPNNITNIAFFTISNSSFSFAGTISKKVTQVKYMKSLKPGTSGSIFAVTDEEVFRRDDNGLFSNILWNIKRIDVLGTNSDTPAIFTLPRFNSVLTHIVIGGGGKSLGRTNGIENDCAFDFNTCVSSNSFGSTCNNTFDAFSFGGIGTINTPPSFINVSNLVTINDGEHDRYRYEWQYQGDTRLTNTSSIFWENPFKVDPTDIEKNWYFFFSVYDNLTGFLVLKRIFYVFLQFPKLNSASIKYMGNFTFKFLPSAVLNIEDPDLYCNVGYVDGYFETLSNLTDSKNYTTFNTSCSQLFSNSVTLKVPYYGKNYTKLYVSAINYKYLSLNSQFLSQKEIISYFPQYYGSCNDTVVDLAYYSEKQLSYSLFFSSNIPTLNYAINASLGNESIYSLSSLIFANNTIQFNLTLPPFYDETKLIVSVYLSNSEYLFEKQVTFDYSVPLECNTCKHEGTCTRNLKANSVQCKCPPFFSGVYCEQCSVGFVLINDTCRCPYGKYLNGSKCSIDYSLLTCFGKNYTDKSVCSSKGICIDMNVCVCNTGYTGSECTIPICNGKNASNPQVCGGVGVCIAPNQCNCGPNFLGQDCQFPACNSVYYGIACSQHGKCNTTTYLCECFRGYSGSNCEKCIDGFVEHSNNCFPACFGISSLDSRVCSGNGNCIANGTIPTCICKTNYTGSNCEFGGNNTMSTCKENYGGSNCAFELRYGSISIINPKYDFSIITSIVSKDPYVSIDYSWKEDSGSFTTPIANQSSLVIKANTIVTEGLKLNFTLTVTITEPGSKVSVIKKTFSTRVNTLPIIQEFKLLDNSTGLQTTNGVGFQTVFKVSSLAYDPDSDPITYSIGYFSGVSNNVISYQGDETTFYFKLPFTSEGYVTLYLRILDSNLGERIQYINVTLSDPTANLGDGAKIDFANQILSSPNVTIADASSSAYYLKTINTDSLNQTVEIRTKLIDVVALNIYSQNKDTALEIVGIVVSEPKLVSYTAQIKVLALMNDSSITSSQADKVLAVTANLLSVSKDSVSSNLIKDIISITAQTKSASIPIGSQSTVVSENINSTVVKNTISSLSSVFDSSIGVNSIKLPSDSISNVLTKNGFDLSNPIVLSLNVASKNLYSYQNWNNTSPFFIFKILSGIDTSKMLSISGLTNPIEFVLNVEAVSSNLTTKCVYVNTETQTLSTEGVETIVISSTKVKCKVYHLTDFTTVPIRKIETSTSNVITKPTTSIVLGNANMAHFSSILVLLVIMLAVMV